MRIDVLARCLLVAFCWVGVGPVVRADSRTVILMDGFLVDRLERAEIAQPDTDTMPRRSLESVLRAPPEPLSLDIPAAGTGRPQDDEVVRRRRAAELHYQEGRMESALRDYQQLMRLRPGHLPFVARAALLAVMVEQYSLADTYFEELHRAVPLRADYLVAWGGVLIRLARYDDAEDVLAQALEIQPNHPTAHYTILMRNVAAGREINDRFWTYRALPELVSAAGWLVGDEADLRRIMDDTQMQIMLQTVLGDVSAYDLAAVYRALRAAYMQLNSELWDEAYALLEEGRSLGVDRPYLELEQIRCLVERGDYVEAVRRADVLMETQGHPLEMQYGYGYILVKGGEYERAAEILEVLSGEYADQWHIRIALAYAWAGSGRMDEAWPIIEALAERFPNRLSTWMEGDAPYLDAIRSDPRYPALLRRAGY